MMRHNTLKLLLLISLTSSADRELRLAELRENAAKNTIVTYNKHDLKEAGGIEAFKSQLKETCQCELEHLESIGAFVLHYESADHMSAAQLKMRVRDVAHASDDLVVHMDFGKITKISNEERVQDR